MDKGLAAMAGQPFLQRIALSRADCVNVPDVALRLAHGRRPELADIRQSLMISGGDRTTARVVGVQALKSNGQYRRL